VRFYINIAYNLSSFSVNYSDVLTEVWQKNPPYEMVPVQTCGLKYPVSTHIMIMEPDKNPPIIVPHGLAG